VDNSLSPHDPSHLKGIVEFSTLAVDKFSTMPTIPHKRLYTAEFSTNAVDEFCTSFTNGQRSGRFSTKVVDKFSTGAILVLKKRGFPQMMWIAFPQW
jgi:hypothetical protein